MLIIPIFISHQGCPHDCLFCNQQKISGQKREGTLHPGKTTRIINEWLAREDFRRKRRAVQVAFFGGSFTCLPQSEQERLLGEVQPFLAEQRIHSIRCSTRPDCIDDMIAVFLQRHGVTTVELGIQSMDDRVLRLTRRGHTVAQSKEALVTLKAHGFIVGAQLMPGLPGESRFGFLRGVKKLLVLRPNLVRLYPALVIEDSALAEMYRRGHYLPLSLATAVCLCAAASKLCRQVDVKVIRMGLHPSASLEENIIDGPYHPAFGEMVFSRLWRQRLLRKLRRLERGEKLCITVSHRDISAVVGIHQENKKQIDALGFTGRYSIVADRAVEQGSIYAVSK